MKLLFWIVGLLLLAGLLRLVDLYTQVFRYQAYWNRHNQQTLASSRVENIRYYVLGDSTAQGVGASSPKKSYPFLVAQELDTRKDEQIELINLSKSGANIKDVLNDQLPVMQSLGVKKNSVITIEVGANDMMGFEPNKFEKEMDELMGKLPKQAIISDVPSFAGSRLSKYEGNILEANQIIVRLVDKHNLKRAQLYDRTSRSHGVSTFSSDLFHPSNRGYRTNWASAFIEQL